MRYKILMTPMIYSILATIMLIAGCMNPGESQNNNTKNQVLGATEETDTINWFNNSPNQQGRDAILFEEGAYEKRDICSIQMDGTGYVNLTEGNGADNYNPSWSPDRKMIAYLSKDGENTFIKTMNNDGTKTRTLKLICADSSICFNCEYARPEWSPDGKSIAFTAINIINTDQIANRDQTRNNAAEDLYVIDIYNGNCRKLSNVQNSLSKLCSIMGGYRHPVWSPDGNKIAFVSKYKNNPNSYDIQIINLAGTVSDTIENGMAPCFIKDDNHLLYESAGIEMLNLDSGLKSIITQGNNPLVAPNNDKMAFQNRRDTYILDLTNNKLTKLEIDTYWMYFKAGTYAWSPDSKHLAIIMTDVKDLHFSNIYVIDIETGKLRNITNKAANYPKITW